MIKTKTVFVLGAGASMPYGFPSGAQLRADIIGAEHDTHWLAKYLVQTIGLEGHKVRDFARAFHQSGVTSIDSFLTRRPEFVDIGKVAIASCLCRLEEPERLEQEKNDDHWYGHLWNAMVDGTVKIEDVGNNAVKFITFNYDRSLEAYLFRAAKNTYGRGDEQALKCIKDLGVVHVYGQLGEFHYEPGDGRRQYETTTNRDRIRTAAAGIHIMPEQRGDEVFAMARAMFEWAETICFLGFGFDPLNVDRLNLESVVSRRREQHTLPRIVASTYQRTVAEGYRIMSVLCPSQQWDTYNAKNTMTLRESALL